MAQGRSGVNIFNDGMSQDVDILNQQATSYRDSMNGRLLFNKDGSYSWETENGTKTSFLLAANDGLDSREYKVIGNTGNNNIRVIFSTTEDGVKNSEIGIFSIDEAGIGSYKTLFNDINDPNGDLFNFLTTNQIEARFVYENPKLIRAYWVDGIKPDSNRPRVITFSFDGTIATPVDNQSDVSAYVSNNQSVFSMNSQTDFDMGLIKYVGNIGGGLVSGAYQYTYSLGTTEGYWTPWYPPTRRVLCIPDQVSSTNWNEYEMGSSGIATNKGNLIEIKGVDQRYDRIRVAYVLAYTSASIVESRIFAQSAINSNVMQFQHVGNVGEPLLTSEIADLFSGLLGAKTLNIKDATLYYGNIKENVLQDFDIEPILANLTITPKFRDMRSDEWVYGNGSSGGTNGPARGQRPVTHGWPRNGITQMRQHSAVGGVEDYTISNDYLNYKGTQIDHLYPGYFRGETYRFAIVFYDKLGFESFAFHLGDIKLPNQSENEYEWSRVKADATIYNSGTLVLPTGERAWPTNNYNTPTLRSEKIFVGDNGQNLAPMNTINPSVSDANRKISHLRIMGLDFSGIDISSIAPFISGFKIVRSPRDASILLQGMLLPCVGTTVDKQIDGSEPGGRIVVPLPSTHQNFYDFANGAAPSCASNPNAGFGGVALTGLNAYNHDGDDGNDRYFANPNASVMYAPGLNFGTAAKPTIQSQDRVTLVGGCWAEHTPGVLYNATASNMYFTKQYYSRNTFHYGAATQASFDGSEPPFPRYMSFMEGIIRTDILGPRGHIDNWATSPSNIRLNADVGAQTSGDPRRSHGMFSSLFIAHGNFIPAASCTTPGPFGFSWSAIYRNNEAPRFVDDDGSPNAASNMLGGFICNWVRPNASPYGGISETSLEQSIFYGTGHFQPVNNPTFDAQGMPNNLVFDNIEVFGGDCFLDYISHVRQYPHNQDIGDDDDYSDARSWPWEDQTNHSLREALSEGGVAGGLNSLTWANVGTRTHLARATLGDAQWSLGLFSGDPGATPDTPTGVFEEFNINAVLNFQELTVFYSTKPVNFLANDIFPVRWRYSPTKIYGDPIDTWRLFQVNDFRDLNGTYGEITSSLYIFNQIYSWQIGAFGRLRASDRALIESQQGGTLSTGIGDKLDGIDYISTEFGNQHQWGLFSSDKAAYWIDVNKRKIMRFAQDGQNPLSDIKGLHQFLEGELPLYENYDNPVNNRGVHGTFDFGNNEAVFTFNRDRTITPDINNQFVLISRVPDGKTFSQYLIEQNQTAVLGPLVASNDVLLPTGNVGVGINENTIMYLYVENPPQFIGNLSIGVYNVNNSSSTLLFQAVAGTYYRLYRHGLKDDWLYEEVTANDATPHKSSLTFNEYGNWFVSFHGFAPTHYMSTKFVVMSQDVITDIVTSNAIQVHDMGLKGDFLSFSKKSYISSSVNEIQMISKEFDSLRINCNEDFNSSLDMILMATENQFYFLDMPTDTRKKYLEDILRVPLRAEDQPNRMRGKHLLMTLELKNNFNYNDRITNLVTYFRESNRI